MPFVTEEIWHQLPGTEGSIMRATYPEPTDRFMDDPAEQEMALVTGIITGIRNVRGEMNIAPSVSLNVSIQAEGKDAPASISAHKDLITDLARLDTINIAQDIQRPKAAATSVVSGATIYVSLEGVIDITKEVQRLEKEIEKLNRELSSVEKKLQNPNFLSKAPENVVSGVKEKHAGLSEKQQKLKLNLEKITAMGTD
jgi:valyl-tRNA synthetase